MLQAKYPQNGSILAWRPISVIQRCCVVQVLLLVHVILLKRTEHRGRVAILVVEYLFFYFYFSERLVCFKP